MCKIWFIFTDAELHTCLRGDKLTFPKLPFPRTLMNTKSCKSILLTSGVMWPLTDPFSWLPPPAALPSTPSCPPPLLFALIVASEEAAERRFFFFSSPWWSNDRTFRMLSSSLASCQDKKKEKKICICSFSIIKHMSFIYHIFVNLARMVKWGQTCSDHLQFLPSLIKPAGGPEPEAAVG